MSTYTIWHNPRCTKSRETLALLESKGIHPEVRLYLEDSPDAERIKDVLSKLKLPAEALVRKGEAIYKEQFKGKAYTEDQWISILVRYPKLIERPIVIRDNQAIIGRPPESVLRLIK